MSSIIWEAGSGDWGDAADWSGGTVPTSADDVTIDTAGITVTISTGAQAARSLTTSQSVLAITGGTLTTTTFATIGGAFQQSGGLWIATGSGIAFTGSASQTAGTLVVQQGLLSSTGSFSEGGGLVQIDQGAAFSGPLTVSAGTIDLAGGTLTVGGAYTQSGGTLTLASNNATFLGPVSQTGGTIQETSGLLISYGSFQENGGTMLLNSSGADFKGAFSLASGAVTLTSGSLTSELSYTQSGGTMMLESNGTDVFYGATVQSGGTLDLAYGSLISYGTFLENGGLLQLGFGGGTFTGNLTERAGTISSTAPTLSVNGSFTQTGGLLELLGRDATFTNSFAQAAGGTILVQSGALQLEGLHESLSGTISGAGTLLIQGGTATLNSGVVLSLPEVELIGGKLILGASLSFTHLFATSYNSVLSLAGNKLALGGIVSLDGVIGNAGTIAANGGGQLNGLELDGTVMLDLNAAFNQTGDISLGGVSGSRAQMTIGKAGSLHLVGNTTVNDQSGYGLLANHGTLAKTGGTGTAYIRASTTSTGTVTVATGTLDFSGRTNVFGGTVNGAGTVSLSNGADSFSKSLALNVGRFLLNAGNEQLTLKTSLAYGGEWDQVGGTLWLNGPKVTLSLSGVSGLDGGLITGSGRLAATSSSSLNVAAVDIEGVATLDVAGTVDQTASVTLGAQTGSAASIVIEHGAIWKIENNGSLGGVAGSPSQTNGTITNAGTLEKLNGSLNSAIDATLVSTGSLIVGNATLSLYGGGSLAGTLSGAGSLDIHGDFTLKSGLDLAVGSLSIGDATSIYTHVAIGGSLADTGAWSQEGGTFALAGNTLSLSGLTSLDGGTLSGLGTLASAGATTLGGGYAVLQAAQLILSGTAEQAGDITVGDFNGGTQPASVAALQIAAGGVYTLDDAVNIAGNGTLSVAAAAGSLAAGLIQANGAGTETIGASLVVNGMFSAGSAQLTFLGPVSGTGSITVGAGGSLHFQQDTVSAATTIGFAGGMASLFLDDPVPGTNSLAFGGLIAGFGSGDAIEISTLQSNVAGASLTLSDGNTVLTIKDQSGDTASLHFSTAQTLSSLTLGLGAHGDLTVFHT